MKYTGCISDGNGTHGRTVGSGEVAWENDLYNVGFLVSGSTIVSDCISTNNGARGYYVATGATLSNCYANGNYATGWTNSGGTATNFHDAAPPSRDVTIGNILFYPVLPRSGDTIMATVNITNGTTMQIPIKFTKIINDELESEPQYIITQPGAQGGEAIFVAEAGSYNVCFECDVLPTVS